MDTKLFTLFCQVVMYYFFIMTFPCHLTGVLLARVSWQCSQTNPDVRVSGFRMLVNGKQYGGNINSTIGTLSLKVCENSNGGCFMCCLLVYC